MGVLLLAACLPTVSQAWARQAPAGWAQVCTLTGMVWVHAVAELAGPAGDSALDASPGAVPAAPDPLAMHAVACGWCQWHAGMVGGVPPSPLTLVLPMQAATVPGTTYRSAQTARVWQTARSRAPPLSA